MFSYFFNRQSRNSAKLIKSLLNEGMPIYEIVWQYPETSKEAYQAVKTIPNLGKYLKMQEPVLSMLVAIDKNQLKFEFTEFRHGDEDKKVLTLSGDGLPTIEIERKWRITGRSGLKTPFFVSPSFLTSGECNIIYYHAIDVNDKLKKELAKQERSEYTSTIEQLLAE